MSDPRTQTLPGGPPDRQMEVFMTETWKAQGLDFEFNLRENLPRLTRKTMWTSLPPLPSRGVCIVGAGPSLSGNLDGGIPPGLVLACTDRALPLLMKKGREPEYVLVAEGTMETLPDIESWWRDVDTSGMTLITTPIADPGLLDLWKGEVKWLNPYMQNAQLFRYARKVLWKTGCDAFPTGSNVGVMGVIIMGKMLQRDFIPAPAGGAPPITPRSAVPEPLGASSGGVPGNTGEGGAKPSLALLGMDHCVYEPVAQCHIALNDVLGRPCWVPWNFFIGQYEIRVLAGQLKAIGAQVVNCTEGGIIYGGDILRRSLGEVLRSDPSPKARDGDGHRSEDGDKGAVPAREDEAPKKDLGKGKGKHRRDGLVH